MFRQEIAPGITLTPVMPSDALELFCLVDRERPRLGAWFPWVAGTRTVADTRTFIADSMAHFGRGDGVTAVIREDSAIIGVVGLLLRDPVPRTFELGYWLASAAEGRGIAFAAAGWMTERALTILEARRVIVRAAVGNHRSRALAERLGFAEEGVLRRAGMLQPPEDLVILVRHVDASLPPAT